MHVMTHYRSKKIIAAGFVVILFLFVTLLGVWLQSIHENSRLLQEIANEQLKTKLITTMRDTTHRRAIALHRMPYLDDPFDRDEEYIHFRELGSDFLNARDELFAMKLSDVEKAQWKIVRSIMNNGGRIQQKVIQLIIEEEDLENALVLLQEKLVPNQDEFVDAVTNILDKQREGVENETAKAKQQNKTTYLLLALLSTVGLLLGIFTVFVVRRTGRTEEALMQQGESIRALYEVTSMSGIMFNEQIDEMLKLGCRLLDTETGSVRQINVLQNINKCINIYSKVETEFTVGSTFPLDKTFCLLTIEENGPIAIANAGATVYRSRDFYKNTGINTYMATPLTTNSKLFGTVNFYSRAPHDRPFTLIHKDLLNLIGSWISVALERQYAQEELRHAKDDAENANKTKSAFLANMSHELRTPLNAIIGYGELLIEDAEDKNQNRTANDLSKIIKSGRHLLSLIDDVLDLSKIEAGRMSLSLENVHVKPIVDDVASVLTPALAKNSNILSIDNNDHELDVYADKVRLKQVLFNLLSNANKFTKSGKITFRIYQQKDKHHWVFFEIRDSGIGMSSDQIDKLFVAFTQASPTISKRFGGTGLGLAISRLFCNMMGGDISVKSELEAGSIFTVRLPAAAPEKQNTAEVA